MYSSESYWLGLLGASLLVFGVICLIVTVFSVIVFWKVFEKANKPGWYSIIPVYNTIVLLEILGLKWYYIFGYCLSAIPAVGPFLALFFNIVISVKVAKAYGKEPAFGIGVAFLPLIFYAIIAFDGSIKYVGPVANGDLDFNNLF